MDRRDWHVPNEDAWYTSDCPAGDGKVAAGTPWRAFRLLKGARPGFIAFHVRCATSASPELIAACRGE